MSKASREEVVCGRCGQRSTQTVYTSVNAVRSPALRADILAQRLHCFECPYCRGWFASESPFAYIDVQRKQWIVHHPPSWEPSFREHEDEVRRTYAEATEPPHVPASVAELFAGTRVRAVFGLAALREKILCFDAGLDDALLEALKLDLMRSAPGLWFHPLGRPRLESVSAGELTFVATPAEGGEEALARITVPRSASEDLARTPGFEGLIAELREGLYVDAGRIMFDGTDG